MTCILATIHNNKVHMIGDMCGSNGFTHKNYTKNVKVFTNKDFLVGYTTCYRMGQILQYSWEPPVKSLDYSDDVYIYKHIVNSLKAVFEANGFGCKNGISFSGGNFLLGWKGRIFEMQDNISILEHEQFASVGCGEYFAEASMATQTELDINLDDPEKFLSTALRVTSGLVTGVSSEYNYIEEV